MSICYWLVAAQVGHVVTKAEITFVRGHSHWRKLRRLPQPWNSTLITLMRMEEAENGIAGIMFFVEIRTLRQSCLAQRVRGGVVARVQSPQSQTLLLCVASVVTCGSEPILNCSTTSQKNVNIWGEENCHLCDTFHQKV